MSGRSGVRALRISNQVKRRCGWSTDAYRRGGPGQQTPGQRHLDKKAGFRKLIRLILQEKVKKLVLTHKEQLLRFGSEIILQICHFLGVKITILQNTPDKPRHRNLLS